MQSTRGTQLAPAAQTDCTLKKDPLHVFMIRSMTIGDVFWWESVEIMIVSTTTFKSTRRRVLSLTARFPQNNNNKRLFSNSESADNKRVTFAKQLELPLLPIPELKDTASRYLNAIQSLSDLSKEDFEKEKSNAEKLHSQAKVIQAELEKLTDDIQTSYSKWMLDPEELSQYVKRYWQVLRFVQ